MTTEHRSGTTEETVDKAVIQKELVDLQEQAPE